MNGWPVLLAAQVTTELRDRLRSASTVVAAVGLFVAALLWIPDPASNATSIAWTSAGQRVSGVYSAAFLGFVAAALASTLLGLFGFYLVVGSIRRARERGVGAIIAATPLARTTYIVATFAAHFAYLLVLGALALMAGVIVFLRYGTGPLSIDSFLRPGLLLTAPSLLFTAALTVAFETLPLLRGRAGAVLYFFVWTTCATVPLLAGGDLGSSLAHAHPAVPDPAGLAAISQIVLSTVPSAEPGTISTGRQVHAQPVERVAWPATRFPPSLLASRAFVLLWTALPLVIAVLAFDRFDPARARAGVRRRREGGPAPAPEPDSAPSVPGGRPTMDGLAAAEARPSFARAVHAEAWLVWQSAGWLRWPLLVAACGAAFSAWSGAVFLLLLAPVLSEVAPREELHGTQALVWIQPSLKHSFVAWKAAAAGVFVIALGVPGLVRATLAGPTHAAAWISGLLFVAWLAVGTGTLTRGGKLFSAVYTMLWYASVSAPGSFALDYCGVFGGGTSAAVRLTYAATAALAVVLAASVEAARARG